MAHIQTSELISAPPQEVFSFMTDLQGLPGLLQDHFEVRVVNAHIPVEKGVELAFLMERMGVAVDVRIKVDQWVPGSRFSYRMIEGVFQRWQHTEKFELHGERQTLVTDIVDYDVPLGILGQLADDLWVRQDMTKALKSRLKKVKQHFSVGS